MRARALSSFARALSCVVWLAAVGCGGSASEASTEAPQPAATSGNEAASSDAHRMQIEGTLGTIPPSRIEAAMAGKLPAFQRCFFEGTGEVEFLAGYIKFYFRVGADGRVEYVHPRSSSIGHRATELCLLDIAKRTRFPKPQGGDAAEFVWGFEIDAPGGVRPPVEWQQDRVADAVTKGRAAIAACGVGDAHYVVTAYVSTGGSVLAAGAAADSQPAADKIDCVLSAVKTWRMPDPGSYAAKVSFNL